MKFISAVILITLVLAALSMITNHQGAAQKIIQAAFFLLVINIIFYIYKLRG